MPRSKDVILGGETYKVEQLPMRANKEWRDSLGAPVMQLIDLVQNFDDLELKASDLLRITDVVKSLLLGSMDTLLDALFRYSPALNADREHIEETAYDDEAIAALGVIIGLAYPLDQVLTGLRGLPVTPISMNSRSMSGVNGTKKPTVAPQRSTSRT